MEPLRILMVCLGNICRSPLAEGVFIQKSAELGLFAKTDSCGTSNWHQGESPDPRAIRAAKANHFDIAYLRARQFLASDFDQFDYIFAMDHSNYLDVLALAKTEAHRSKVHLYLEFAGITEPRDVPDPYYGDYSDFLEVCKLLDTATEQVVNKMIASGR